MQGFQLTLPFSHLKPQAEEALAAGSPESAAAKGRALLNLRLADAEGGLLGRTLLTLVNNKASPVTLLLGAAV